MTGPRHAYRVRRSVRARRSRLSVSEDGEVVVVLPRRLPLAEAERLVAAHAGWLDRQVRRVRAEQERLASRPSLGEGRVLRVHDVPLRTATVRPAGPQRSRGRVEVAGEELRIRPGRDGRSVAELLETWLRAEARHVLTARVHERAVQLRVSPGRISIRDQASRWASASASGALSFSWRLVLAPTWVLDAVVVHELAHLRVRGHSPAFWALVDRHAPQTSQSRQWLREHAREVRAALD